MYYFEAYKRSIASELYFPELLPTASLATADQIQIKFGHVSNAGLDSAIQSTPFFQVSENAYWLSVPHIGRFLVSNGCNIVIDPHAKTDEASLRIFILENCFEALLRQTQMTVLGGAAIKTRDRAVLFLMPAGFGKSTLSTIFWQHDYQILSSHHCVIDKALQLYPSYPAIHLWFRIADQLRIDKALFKPVRSGVEKYQLPIDNYFSSMPVPIQFIYTVDYHKSDTILFDTANYLFEKTIPVIRLTLPRWDYTMNQLGSLLTAVFPHIESDMLKRMGCDVHV